MTVINPNSISGITSITLPSGDGNVLTIHTNDGTERFRIDSSGNVKVGSAATISPDGDLFVTGVCTATTLSGAASGLTGALPAIDGSALTGMASTENVRTGILDVAGISTFRNTMNVGAAVTISESGIEASGIGITCANINGTQIGGRRNLIINGAMTVAQRGTSSTSDNYQTVDRFAAWETSVDESRTQSQITLNSTDSGPYQSGFRKAFRLTNGDQTSGAQANSRIFFSYTVEAQDMANCGWDYTSTSSFITLSFWVRASVAQNYYGYLYNFDGTNLGFSFETGSLSANTWKKVVIKVPGASDLAFNDDNGQGFYIVLSPFFGTNYTDSGNTLKQWAAWSGSSRMPDYATTWYTTNDATFDWTGVQLEVGTQATPFEHRSFTEELTLCERYCETILQGESDGAYMVNCVAYTTNQLYAIFRFKVEKRVSPTLVQTSGSNYYINYRDTSGIGFDSFNGLSWPNVRATGVYQSSTSFVSGQAGLLGSSNSNALILVTAEL